MDFLSEENVCGQNLLKLVARGSAILTEIQRLSDNIPKVFLENNQQQNKYSKLLFDFSYLTDVDKYEETIQSDIDLLDLDENFKESYLPLLERFYILFESIYKYYLDLIDLIQEIKDGVFIQYNIENILHNIEGKKLMGESFYLYGCMLMLMDNFIIGSVREKILVSYFRYKGGQSGENINEVCKLCRSSGYLPPIKENPPTDGIVKRPKNYPEEFFSRFPIDEELIFQIILSIKDDDIYNSLSAYPQSEYRSIAHSNQASMLFILLYFNPDILQRENAKMREIIDKHFCDNWVIPYYMGYTVDLSEQWIPYDAARNALLNTIEYSYVKYQMNKYIKKMEESYKQCKEYLVEGVLTEEYVLDKINKLLQTLKESNIAVRWLILHRTTSNKKAYQILNEKINPDDILSLLLQCSQFESIIKKIFENLIETKQIRWDNEKNSAAQKMEELADYFSGNKPLTKVQPDENFQKWFETIKEQISQLTYNDSTYAGRKIQQLTKALEDVEQYHQIEHNIQIKQYLIETRMNLKTMVRIVNVKKNILSNIALISDISYSWECLKDYSILMQQKIKKDPKMALLLKACFMKLSSIMNTPMVRIIQANSPDFVSVSKYYSGELIKFVKIVLQIIPMTVFQKLEDLITLLTLHLKKIPLKIDRSELKDYAQSQNRLKMANLTNQISVFAESILSMETYLIGIIEVNPKEILEDGIRRELIKLIAKILDRTLVFKQSTAEDFEKKLNLLADNLDGLKKSLEYIQDFVNIYGLKIFYDEFNRLINSYIDMEACSFLTSQLPLEELKGDREIPLPDPKLSEPGTKCFMGRLLGEIIKMCNPLKTKYIDICNAFYDIQTQKEVFSLKTISLIYKCIGVSGLHGLDKLLSFMIVHEMKKTIRLLKMELDDQTLKNLRDVYQQMKGIRSFDERFDKFYFQLRKMMKGLSLNSIPYLQNIGQFVLMRKLICLQLNMIAKVNSNKHYLALESLNESIINDLVNRPYNEKQEDETFEMENKSLYEIMKLLNFAGFSDPIKKIYITNNPIDCLPMIIFIIASSFSSKINFNIKQMSFEKKIKNDNIDGSCFIVGLLAFLNQFHRSNLDIFLGLWAQNIRSQINYQVNPKNQKNTYPIIQDLIVEISFFEECFKFLGLNQQEMDQYIDIKMLTAIDTYLNIE